MNRRRGLTVLGIAAALMLVVGAVALLRRDDGGKKVNVSSDSNTTASTDSTPPSVIPAGPSPIWPFASMNRTFASAEQAAKSFAVDYLGMTHARVGKTLPPANAGGATSVEVFPNDRASLRTLVDVVEQAPRGWVVISSGADEITVDRPRPHDPLAASMNVSGKSRAFEATLGVELRPYGSTTPVFKAITMGGSTEILPFSTTISPPATDQPLVLVIFEGDPSGQGAVTQATVIPLDAAT